MEVETYTEAASLMGDYIQIELERLSPWLSLYDNAGESTHVGVLEA